ncbi:MAG TPA: RNA 2',3'-cyclic phosphodiesterase [Symbiobacteriaceae bacterium]|nr:RNA 2',3'-cyclic phosphodiesterase [Symbiobacteriaceae bacterium]
MILPRCFVAVEVKDAGLLRTLDAAQMGLRRAFGTPDPVKWVPAHQFHFTLKFLGEVEAAAAARAMAAVRRAAAGAAPFSAAMRGLGCFPGPVRPSVLWAGVAEGADGLGQLAARVEQELAREGFPPERRPFKPHLTLGRVREGAFVPRAAVEALAEAERQDFGRFGVERLVLMKSELTPRGPIYTPYGVAALGEDIR